MANWTYLLADLRSNNVLAQVPLSSVQPPSLRLNTAGQLSGSIPVRSIPGDPYKYTAPARTCIYALRNGVPWWGGIIWTRKYTASAGTVDFQASDWWSYFDHRFILGAAGVDAGNDFALADAQVGAADPGTTAHGTLGFGYTGPLVGQTDIIKQLFQNAAYYRGGDLRLAIYATNTAGIQRQQEYRNFDLVSYGKAFSDWADMADGPDLLFGVNGWDTTGAPQRCVWIGDPELVRSSGSLVFTYGGNLLDYTWNSDGTGVATRTWASSALNDIATMMSRVDAGDMIDGFGWPLLETKQSYDTIAEGQWQQLQAQSASDALNNRKPIVTPSLTVRTDVSPYLDYGPGDTARLIIEDDYFRTRLDTTVKIVDVAPSASADTAVLGINPVDEDVS
jgi:hypothetical protein